MANGIAVGLKSFGFGPVVNQAAVGALANLPPVPVADVQKNFRTIAGVWSMVGTLLLCTLIGAHYGGFETLLGEFGTFLTGGVLAVEKNGANYLEMVPLIMASTALEVPASFICLFSLLVVFGGKLSENHKVGESIKKIDGQRSLFKTFILLCLAEEVFAREILLGWVYGSTPVLSGPAAFYTLTLIGNGIWSFIHLANYAKEDRHILKVLPQFVAGIFFTYIYVKYGLMGSLLDHFASNAVLFCLHKKQRTNLIDMLLITFAGVVSWVTLNMMDKPLSDMLPWFGTQAVFELEGWVFKDYLLAGLFATTAPKFIFGLLLYDRSNIGAALRKQKSSDDDANLSPLGWFFASGAAIAVVLLIIYGLFWFLGLFIEDVFIRILTLSIAMTCLVQSNSVSAMARTFWTNLPANYVYICSLMALGFWWSLPYVIAKAVILLPSTVLLRYDD